jgi:hypothetical protein
MYNMERLVSNRNGFIRSIEEFPAKYEVKLNLQSSERLLKNLLKNIRSFLHISTRYINITSVVHLLQEDIQRMSAIAFRIRTVNQQ